MWSFWFPRNTFMLVKMQLCEWIKQTQIIHLMRLGPRIYEELSRFNQNKVGKELTFSQRRYECPITKDGPALLVEQPTRQGHTGWELPRVPLALTVRYKAAGAPRPGAGCNRCSQHGKILAALQMLTIPAGRPATPHLHMYPKELKIRDPKRCPHTVWTPTR